MGVAINEYVMRAGGETMGETTYIYVNSNCLATCIACRTLARLTSFSLAIRRGGSVSKQVDRDGSKLASILLMIYFYAFSSCRTLIWAPVWTG